MAGASIAFNVNRIKRQLEVWLGKDNVSAAEVDKICYSRDAWPLRLIRLGRLVLDSKPDLIVWPQTVEQIQQIREMEGIGGIHIMAIEWEDKVAEIIEKAGLRGNGKK